MFSGGNLCDTPYTSWDPEDSKNLGKLHISEIISEYEKFGCNDIVITGGEPTMQKEELLELCKAIKKSNTNAFITLETNGTIFGEFAQHIELASISPKLQSSIPFGTKYEKIHKRNMTNKDAMKKYQNMYSGGILDIQWKFVFTGQEDLNEILKFSKELEISRNNIYLMPEGITREQLESKRISTIDTCLEHGLNFTDRLHIIAWGNKRGV